MRVALAVVMLACGAPSHVTLQNAAGSAQSKPGARALRTLSRNDSIEQFCAPIAAEEAATQDGPCPNEHGSCAATAVPEVAPLRVSVLAWHGGSSSERKQDVAIETARGAFRLGLELTTDHCDPEEMGPPNGPVSVAMDRGALVARYDEFDRHVRVAPDSPPNQKRACTVRCEVTSDVPRCEEPDCSAWSDAP